METCKEEERETNQRNIDESFCCSGQILNVWRKTLRVNSRFMNLYEIQEKFEQNLTLSKSHYIAPLSTPSRDYNIFTLTLPWGMTWGSDFEDLKVWMLNPVCLETQKYFSTNFWTQIQTPTQDKRDTEFPSTLKCLLHYLFSMHKTTVVFFSCSKKNKKNLRLRGCLFDSDLISTFSLQHFYKIHRLTDIIPSCTTEECLQVGSS